VLTSAAGPACPAELAISLSRSLDTRESATKQSVAENGRPNAIASNPSSVLPRAEMLWLHDKLRLVELRVKRKSKIDAFTCQGERKYELKYSPFQRVSSSACRRHFRRFSTVNPPYTRRKSTAFCTCFSPQIRRFSALSPHVLHIIFIDDNPHNFSAAFSQEFAESSAGKKGEKKANRARCGNQRTASGGR
jgi:hypothetical protein